MCAYAQIDSGTFLFPRINPACSEAGGEYCSWYIFFENCDGTGPHAVIPGERERSLREREVKGTQGLGQLAMSQKKGRAKQLFFAAEAGRTGSP